MISSQTRRFTVALTLGLGLFAATAAQAEVGIGADVASRYVWRGTDAGDGVSVQPSISYSTGAIEIGSWASYPISAAAGANEINLYLTYSGLIEGLSVTVTDYYFPQSHPDGGFLEFSDGGGAHSVEISASFATGSISLMGGYSLLNDEKDEETPIYVELGYDLGEVSDGVTAGLFVGFGNGQYTIEDDSAFAPVNAGITLSNDEYSASYIINPDSETSFLVLGKSL